MSAMTPHTVVLRSNELAIRTATESFGISQLRTVLDEQHYLKAGRPAGHVLWQGAYEHDSESGIDRLVAVFCWAGAAKRLKDRDEWIGWDAVATYSGAKDDCELPVGQAILAQTAAVLPNAVVTSDALHNQKKRR